MQKLDFFVYPLVLPIEIISKRRTGEIGKYETLTNNHSRQF